MLLRQKLSDVGSGNSGSRWTGFGSFNNYRQLEDFFSLFNLRKLINKTRRNEWVEELNAYGAIRSTRLAKEFLHNP